MDIHCYRLSRHALRFIWSPPPTNTRNGAIQNYHLVLTDINENVLQNKTVFSRESHDINNLKAFTKYKFIVSAATSVGFGPYSKPKECRTKEGGLCYSFVPRSSMPSLYSSFKNIYDRILKNKMIILLAWPSFFRSLKLTMLKHTDK